MFYTRARRSVVRPDNVKSWMKKMKSKGRKRFHLWEVCSGSGRLSLLALMSGLTVLFPVDLRYGWDVGYGLHQYLLREVQQELAPEDMMMEPNCRPWSISFNRCSPEKVEED